MKLVINKCYGGFSVSPKAVKRLAELQGKKCYFFTSDLATHTHTRVEIDGLPRLFWSAYTVPNPDEVAGKQDGWHEMTMEERKASNERWEAITLESMPENRADPLLVQVVEELGKDADGDCAKLQVIEIPDGVDYEIDEYDGMESVHEKHRIWA